MIGFVYDDGGRAAAGYRGEAGDCITRAIAIASGLPYQHVYDELRRRMTKYAANRRGKIAKAMRRSGATTPRNGVFPEVYRPFLDSLGWEWVPTMKTGHGCKVHLWADELPRGRLIVQVTKHIVAVIDGMIHDTHDPSRDGRRCVYGYFRRPEDAVRRR